MSALVLDHRWGIGRGFDRYFDDFDRTGWRRQTRRTWGRCGATAHKTVAAAVSWLDERPTGRLFFLWLHLYDLHDPYAPREPFTSRYP